MSLHFEILPYVNPGSSGIVALDVAIGHGFQSEGSSVLAKEEVCQVLYTNHKRSLLRGSSMKLLNLYQLFDSLREYHPVPMRD